MPFVVRYRPHVTRRRWVEMRIKVEVVKVGIQRCLPIVVVDLSSQYLNVAYTQVEDVRLRAIVGAAGDRLRKIATPITVHTNVRDGVCDHQLSELEPSL